MSVAEYAAKFEELSRYYSLYVGDTGEKSKCIKFEIGLRPEIKKQVGMQEISGKGASSGDGKGHGNNYSYGGGRGNPNGRGVSNGNSVASRVTWHMNVEMLELLVLIVQNRATSAPHALTQGRLNSLETRVPKPADLNPMEESLPLVYDLIVNTPTSNYVDTPSVCVDISIHVCGRDFLVNLYLPLRLVDVILGMDWLSTNRVRVDFYSKTIEFMEQEEREKPSNISANQVKALLKEDV
ncbi:uncharacterized protein [Cicer arietinum]|uniref:uncharacterized protein n=1 Tax=Cicer arietinum TaxID=3827 RepID=UPI003CC58807